MRVTSVAQFGVEGKIDPFCLAELLEVGCCQRQTLRPDFLEQVLLAADPALGKRRVEVKRVPGDVERIVGTTRDILFVGGNGPL